MLNKFVIVLSFFAASFTHASCAEKVGLSDYLLIQCYKEENKPLESKLMRTYQRLLAQSVKEERNSLLISQRLWGEYKSIDCKSITDPANCESTKELLQIKCINEKLKARELELKSRLIKR